MKIYSKIVAIFGVIVLGGAVLAGCGGGEQDPCKGVTCDFGVCDSESGQCTNESTCRNDVECIPGYRCEGRTCTAQTECESDDECDAGVCSGDGVCVNPDTCTEDSECVDRTYCQSDEDSDEGTCKPDPCSDKTCVRGTCERGTGQCVSADSCTKETQVIDCVSGEKCSGGTCDSAETYCDDIECDRGVCSFETGGCTEPADCEGEDSNCFEGRYCNDMGQCQPDLCEQRDITCDNGGTCVKSTGECQNASTCDSNDDCLDNHLCVGGTCRLESVACGDAGGDGGCPGNQTCDYDDEQQTASCAEPDTCETSFDCRDDRQCGGQTCLDPQQCSDDLFEPNNSAEEATDFASVASNGTLSASACSGDTDIYSVDTTALIGANERGTMVVELDVPARERGLGSLDLTVTGPEGSEMGTASTGNLGTESHVEVTTEIALPDHGVYSVEVAAGDDVSTAGVRYDLSANIMPGESVEACRDASPIRIDQRISGTTEEADSSGLGSSCTEKRNPSPEKIYALDIDAPQEVEFRLTPQLSSTDLSMSLRSRCTQAGSETACVDATGAGQKETMTALLGKGTHYLIVQAPAGDDVGGGSFELVVDRIYTACSPTDSYCDQNGTANVCAADGGRFRQVDCDAGCNPATGKCRPPEGDRCLNAPGIDPDNTGTRQISLDQLSNEYQLGADSCVATGEARTGGPDQTFEVTVPPRKAFTADVIFDNEVQGSVYLIEDCNDTDGTCKAGAQGSVDDDDYRERLTYSNLAEESDDDNSETLFLVVDTAAGQSVTSAELQVTFEDVICEPETNRCSSSDDVERCGEFGREYETIDECSSVFGCDGAACVADTCDAAKNATSDARQSGGVTYTGSWDEFSNAYAGSDTCGGDPGLGSSDTAGNESVYQLDLQQQEVVSATLDGDGDFGLYLKEAMNCGTTGTDCPAGVEEEGGAASLKYYSDSAQTLYLVADRESESGGSFTLDIDIETADCSPNTYTNQCDGSGNLEYCNQLGSIESYSCQGGCSNGVCDSPTGEICLDPKVIPADDSEHTFTVDLNNHTDDYDIDGASCMDSSYDDSPGPEVVFSTTVDAGDVIEAHWLHDDPSMYIVSDCQDLKSSCAAGVESASTEEVSLTYQAPSAGTYYIVADVDDVSSTDYSTAGTFRATVNTQSCSPGSDSDTCADTSTKRYCNQQYSVWRKESCPGCNNGTCADGTCSDPYPMSSGDSHGNAYVGNNDIDPVGNNNIGSCSFAEDTAGADWVYEVDLNANETLTADYRGGSCCEIMYLLTDCNDESSCVDAVDDDGSITYTAGGSAETVYIILDHNSYTNDSSYSYNVDIDVQ